MLSVLLSLCLQGGSALRLDFSSLLGPLFFTCEWEGGCTWCVCAWPLCIALSSLSLVCACACCTPTLAGKLGGHVWHVR